MMRREMDLGIQCQQDRFLLHRYRCLGFDFRSSPVAIGRVAAPVLPRYFTA